MLDYFKEYKIAFIAVVIGIVLLVLALLEGNMFKGFVSVKSDPTYLECIDKHIEMKSTGKAVITNYYLTLDVNGDKYDTRVASSTYSAIEVGSDVLCVINISRFSDDVKGIDLSSEQVVKSTE